MLEVGAAVDHERTLGQVGVAAPQRRQQFGADADRRAVVTVVVGMVVALFLARAQRESDRRVQEGLDAIGAAAASRPSRRRSV
jgi:hypothetical protein